MVAIAGTSLKAGDGGEERPPAALLSSLPSSLSCPAKALQVSANGERQAAVESEKSERDEVGWMLSFIHLVMSNILA